MGVQDFDPHVQKAVNRHNSVEEVATLVRVLRKQQYASISMDLIYGLPQQTLASVKTTLELVDASQLPFARGFTLSREDNLRQYVINQIICYFQLDFADLEERFDVLVEQHFKSELDQLAPMIDDGLLERDATGIRVHNGGGLLIRRICMVFDAYLQSNQQPRYSRII